MMKADKTPHGSIWLDQDGDSPHDAMRVRDEKPKSKRRRLLWIIPLALLGCALVVAVIMYIGLTIAWRGGDWTGEPDRLGAWGQINQEIERADGWQQIVHDSPFQLGEKVLGGYWQTDEGDEPYYLQQFGTYPFIDGSTVAVPMAVEFARQHLGFSDEDASMFVNFNTTPEAYANLIRSYPNVYAGWIQSQDVSMEEGRAVDLIIVTEPSPAELDMAQAEGVTLIVEPVAYDAFVFITHKDNPVDSLTLDQIRDIYAGKVTNWKQVGGNDERIVAYQREEGSGSQTAMVSMVMGDRPIAAPPMVKLEDTMMGLIESVAEYQNDAASLGYTFRYYIDNLYKNDQIKLLKIEGVLASDNNIRSQSYPLTATYNGVIRGDDRDTTGGKFLDWMLSDEGQRCIKQAGYIPLR